MPSWAALATPVRDPHATSSHKRLDIQGLRAIAVVMVVAFHAGLPVPGGFVGVDVFFVISGFVITAMLHREWVSTGRIRFRRFYLKRFKRLTPALALMVAVTVVISSVVLYPFADQENVVKTAFGAILLAANFVISKTTGGYFGAAAEANPLLNTWSLSVEEQFYLIFPAVLVLGWVLARRTARLRGAPFLLISGIATLSFGLALAQTLGFTFFGSEILLGFYSTFTRAWEFAAGALLALALTKVTISLTSRFMFVVGAAGISMLAASLWLITGSTSFPGPWTLLPVTGTLLLLLAGTCENRVSRALSIPPMVRVGDWSYSIYLWHWPFIVFAIYLWPFSPYASVLAAAVSLAPALASYYWLEQPIRQRVTRNRIQVTKLITAVMIPPLLLAALVGVTAKYYWQPQYLSFTKPVLYAGDLLPVEEWVYLRGPYSPCDDIATLYQGSLSAQEIDASCGQSKPGAPVDIAIVGDSHAVHLFFGLAEALPRKNIAYFALAAKPPWDDGAEMTRIIDYVAQSPSIKTVILSAYWSSYGVSEERLAETLQRFTQSGKQVFVTDDLPDYPFTPDQCKYGISPLFPTARCSQDLENFETTYSGYYPRLEQAVSQVPGVRLLHTAKYFCDEAKCDMTRDGILLYADNDHLNHQGSRYLAELLLEDSPDFTQSP
jgi:peptidoglycan/LPS O-acetylase OafA/YrhL